MISPVDLMDLDNFNAILMDTRGDILSFLGYFCIHQVL